MCAGHVYLLGGEQLDAATQVDQSATNGDRMSDVIRGHSNWNQAGEGLKAGWEVEKLPPIPIKMIQARWALRIH